MALFSNMAAATRHANLLKGMNSTMFILAVCGRRLFPEGRIVGGNSSSFGKWPWQVRFFGFIFFYSFLIDAPSLHLNDTRDEWITEDTFIVATQLTVNLIQKFVKNYFLTKYELKNNSNFIKNGKNNSINYRVRKIR